MTWPKRYAYAAGHRKYTKRLSHGAADDYYIRKYACVVAKTDMTSRQNIYTTTTITPTTTTPLTDVADRPASNLTTIRTVIISFRCIFNDNSSRLTPLILFIS